MATLIITAFLLTLLLNPVVRTLQKRGIARWIGILIVFVFVGILVFCIFYFAVPPFVSSMEHFLKRLPQFYEMLVNGATALAQKLTGNASADWAPVIEQKAEELIGNIGALGGGFLDFIKQFSSFLLNLTLGIILAYYILLDLDKVRDGFLEFLPRKVREPVAELGLEIYGIFKEFFKGQIVVAMIMGGLTGLLLLCLGVRYALLLGLIAGVAELIPYIGPLIGAVPAVMLAYTVSPIKALLVIVGILVLQQINGGVLGPKLIGERVGVHPITAIIIVLLGGNLFGFLGMLLAIPVFASIKAVVLRFVKQTT